MQIPFLFMSLHGSKAYPAESATAFEDFRRIVGPDIVTFFYKDSYGFPVWCVGTFARNGLTADNCLQYWDNVCDAHGLKAATSYAKELPFYDCVLELSEWKDKC